LQDGLATLESLNGTDDGTQTMENREVSFSFCAAAQNQDMNKRLKTVSSCPSYS